MAGVHNVQSPIWLPYGASPYMAALWGIARVDCGWRLHEITSEAPLMMDVV
jgi:hypothetical protein